MPISAYAQQLANVALAQHAKFRFRDEGDPDLCQQIQAYWNDLGLGFTSCTSVPWSAVFVSWCVRKAGAKKSEFTFAAAHSIFVHAAINKPGAFQGVDIGAAVPEIGDIIQNNRGGDKVTFQKAGTDKHYASHSAIVVETGVNASGAYAMTVGGNEGNAIRRTRVQLGADGKIQQRPINPYIALLKNLK